MRRRVLGTTLAVLAVSAVAARRRGRVRDYTTNSEFRTLTDGWVI